MSSIVLKPGRERSVRNRHPWIFSGAIARSAPVDADEVDVYSDDGIWQARALWSQFSQIRGRIMTWEPNERIDILFIHQRIAQAIELRLRLPA